MVIQFLRSLFYGVVYVKTRNIISSFVAHSGVNLWGLLPIKFSKQN
ncbi:MAG: CPBP family intramembrane metalloprotease [Candidatus Thorarchaeota archaeon]|nr:MAG: CPBP family intramembrane metalloprotease [Candidatus Thorarchaeota archaeon]